MTGFYQTSRFYTAWVDTVDKVGWRRLSMSASPLKADFPGHDAYPLANEFEITGILISLERREAAIAFRMLPRCFPGK